MGWYLAELANLISFMVIFIYIEKRLPKEGIFGNICCLQISKSYEMGRYQGWKADDKTYRPDWRYQQLRPVKSERAKKWKLNAKNNWKWKFKSDSKQRTQGIDSITWVISPAIEFSRKKTRLHWQLSLQNVSLSGKFVWKCQIMKESLSESVR